MRELGIDKEKKSQNMGVIYSIKKKKLGKLKAEFEQKVRSDDPKTKARVRGKVGR